MPLGFWMRSQISDRGLTVQSTIEKMLMISKVLFAKKFSILCDQLGKRLAHPTIAEWYAVLNASLNDQQFSTECDRLFLGAQKMPTPNEFIQGAKAASTCLDAIAD